MHRLRRPRSRCVHHTPYACLERSACNLMENWGVEHTLNACSERSACSLIVNLGKITLFWSKLQSRCTSIKTRRHFAAALDLSAHCRNPPPSPVTSSVNVVCACRHCTYVSTAGGARALSSCSQQVLTKFNTLPKQTDSEPRMRGHRKVLERIIRVSK